MRIFAVGATGFVGRTLVPMLAEAGHEVTVLVRKATPFAPHPRIQAMPGDPMAPGPWQAAAASHDAVVNLAGAPIATRWDSATKERIRLSRVRTTEMVVEALRTASSPKAFICANAVGYFGDQGDTPLGDDAPAGTGFLAEVAQAWQEAALSAQACGHRVIIPRFGVVLGPGGGALGAMLPVFRLGLGGRIGSGRQWFPWIHIEDVAHGIRFALEHGAISGPINFVAPETITNADFTRALAAALNRPAVFAVPPWVLHLVLGEAASMLLTSQRCEPRRLQAAGFSFTYPDIATALRHAVRMSKNAHPPRA